MNIRETIESGINNKNLNMKYLKSISTKAIICYILLSTVVSCGVKNEDVNQPVEIKPINNYLPDIAVVQYDGCEYIYTFRHLAHKGNCKNPIHDCR